MNYLLSTALAVSLLLISATAIAQEDAPLSPENASPKAEPEPDVVFLGGFKGGTNMNFMPEPDEDMLNIPVAGMFGVGGGGGLVLEVFAWDIVGLELDVLYVKTSGSGEIDFGRGFEVKQTAKSTDIQTALLLKVQYPSPLAKPFLGVGVNFVQQLDASFEIDEERVQVNTDPGKLERSYTGFLVSTGVSFNLDPIRLPFEIRGMIHPVDTDPQERALFEVEGSQWTGLGVYSDWAYQIWIMGGVEYGYGL